MLSDNEKKVVALIQGDIPIERNPYEILAKKAGISEDEFIEALQSLNDRKIIRRFGATLRHQKSGYSTNAMVAWNVSEDKIHETGKLMAEFPFVSHCYRRDPRPEWPFNLYTMVHAKSREDCTQKVGEMSEKSQIKDFDILYSTKELKKTSMEYFTEEV
ncbi:MAG: Lrp/AsnC family transcriptional regulator [Desulfobacteraceae bacterium]|nr:Lrp/AsnC family transcriptional regulator [Desulfobacteraceae bacterium]